MDGNFHLVPRSIPVWRDIITIFWKFSFHFWTKDFWSFLWGIENNTILDFPPGIFSTLMASWRTATSSCFSPCNLSLKAPSVKSEARAPRQLRQKRRRQREKTLLEFPSGSLPYSPELVTRRRRTRRREKAEITSTKSPFWDKSIKMPKTDFLWQSLVLSPPTPQLQN